MTSLKPPPLVLLRSAWYLVGLTLVVGCGGEPDEVFGTYTLVGVEGAALPYLQSSDAECDQFISEGELTLNPAGTYSIEFFGPYDCTRGGGQTGTLGRLYNGPFTQAGGELHFEASVQGAGTLQFTGTASAVEAEVTVPPIPPQAGPDLSLQFEIVP